MNNIIYIIFVNTGEVGFCLDAIRLLANLNTKRFSHVTVRGPYNKSLDEDKLKELNSIIKPESITIDGIGNFFDNNQNTVFFKCTGDILKKVWDKKGGYDYYPHITIYDGDNNVFAEKLFDKIKDFKFHIKCGKGKLEKIIIGNGKNGFLINNIDLNKLPPNLNLPIGFPHIIKNLDEEERIALIVNICKYLKENLSK